MFSNKKRKQTSVAIFLTILLIIVAVTVVIAGLSFGTAGLMLLFGVVFQSWKAFLLFILLFLAYAFVLDLISISLINIAKLYLSLTSLLFMIRMITDIFFTWLALQLADKSISGVTIHWTASLAIACTLFFAEIAWKQWVDKPKPSS